MAKKEKWSEIRKKGKQYYIVRYGILSWGIGTTVLCLLLMQIYNLFCGEALFISVFSSKFFLFAPIYLIGFMIGGFFWGLSTWSINERSFGKHK